MDDIYKNIKEYNPNHKWKILIISDGIIPGMVSNKILNSDWIIYHKILFCCSEKY